MLIEINFMGEYAVKLRSNDKGLAEPTAKEGDQYEMELHCASRINEELNGMKLKYTMTSLTKPDLDRFIGNIFKDSKVILEESDYWQKNSPGDPEGMVY